MKTTNFFVVSVISNPVRFESRYELYQDFERRMRQAGVKMITVEIAFGARPFAVTHVSNPYHVQLRTFDELWHKENMINLGINHLSQLHPEWEYVAWIDADVEFTNEFWVDECIQQLQHYQIVQMFQQCVDMGPKKETMSVAQGFVYSYLTGRPRFKPGVYSHWHPGYAWAARREAIDGLGGLYDVSILGSGDHLMAWSLIGEGPDQLKKPYINHRMSPGYVESVVDWQRRATRFIQRDIGFMSGTILHHWHGKKKDRKYRERWEILEASQFDPYLDLKRDSQGVYQLDMDGTDRMIQLRDDIRGYFRARNEDSTDM